VGGRLVAPRARGFKRLCADRGPARRRAMAPLRHSHFV
jgi:hypothetical protein